MNPVSLLPHLVGLDWINVANDKDKWSAVLKSIMTLKV